MDRIGRLLDGPRDALERSVAAFENQAVDLDLPAAPADPYSTKQTTIAKPVTIQGPGTFFGKATRTITLEPCAREGWWFERADLADSLPTRVSVRNVWTTGYIVSNIVLRSGAPHNYVRMVEHIVACKPGMGVDNLTVKIDSGDPPLFTRGSLDLVEAFEQAGIVETPAPARYLTVKEPVSIVSPSGSFVILRPPSGPQPRLAIDAAIDFPNAIGKQRIRFTLDPKLFKDGAVARTNTSATKKFYCQTVGRIFADIRNLGYTHENILIAGHARYANEPRLLHNGKSLEAAWHRAVLDLLAALALVEEGRFVGEVESFKAGHALDVRLFTLLYKHDLLTDFKPAGGA